MDLQDVQPNSHDHTPTGIAHPIASIILYGLSWLFIYFDQLTADDIWTWVWRGLSLVSLLLIIYINWNKAVDILKNKKKNDKE